MTPHLSEIKMIVCQANLNLNLKTSLKLSVNGQEWRDRVNINKFLESESAPNTVKLMYIDVKIAEIGELYLAASRAGKAGRARQGTGGLGTRSLVCVTR